MTAPLKVKSDFPIFTTHPGLVYLDSAATSHKPQEVITAVTDFYTKYNSNIHRGIYSLSQTATDLYEAARKSVADFIGAASPSQIVFTANASQAINLVAYGYARKFLHPGDIVVLSEMEHHSNIVPWLRLKKDRGVKLFFLPLTANFRLDYPALSAARLPVKRIKLVCLAHASNVLGTVNPIQQIVPWLRRQGIKAPVLIDAAQSMPHLPVSVADLQCDFLAFSSHKMLGPSGVGVLWAKSELLEAMDPLTVGSHMIDTVTPSTATWAAAPAKFETGTASLEGVIGLAAAIAYLQKVGWPAIGSHEAALTHYALQQLTRIPGLTLYGPPTATDRLGVFSFNLGRVHAHDVSEVLNRFQVCVRAGHHCAQPLMQALGVPATVRASLYLYNTKKDIDQLIAGLTETARVFKV